jgi:hypothetical protein
MKLNGRDKAEQTVCIAPREPNARRHQWHIPLVTEQLVATEPDIGVPQGNTPGKDRTNTKP